MTKKDPKSCHHLRLHQSITLGIRDGDYICENCGKMDYGTAWKYENRHHHKLNISLKLTLKKDYANPHGGLEPEYHKGMLEAKIFLMLLNIPNSNNALDGSSHFERTTSGNVTSVNTSKVIYDRTIVYNGGDLEYISSHIKDKFKQWKKDISSDPFLAPIHVDTDIEITGTPL